ESPDRSSRFERSSYPIALAQHVLGNRPGLHFLASAKERADRIEHCFEEVRLPLAKQGERQIRAPDEGTQNPPHLGPNEREDDYPAAEYEPCMPAQRVSLRHIERARLRLRISFV